MSFVFLLFNIIRYDEYDQYWRCENRWQDVDGIAHFTAIVWKGIDKMGCAQNGQFYVCQYGSSHCMSNAYGAYGGLQCWASTPSHLPNFNVDTCPVNACVECRNGDLDLQRRVAINDHDDDEAAGKEELFDELMVLDDGDGFEDEDDMNLKLRKFILTTS
jgi:hypothetical protein